MSSHSDTCRRRFSLQSSASSTLWPEPPGPSIDCLLWDTLTRCSHFSVRNCVSLRRSGLSNDPQPCGNRPRSTQFITLWPPEHQLVFPSFRRVKIDRLPTLPCTCCLDASLLGSTYILIHFNISILDSWRTGK
ncbi:hypothetical protein VTJ04DRAFT_1524 [Mycothermus thermophilus]|uniref:uncharacterized protein n=1 Tax=Humicola insolens TaxID=85995 RepID=UPI0037440C52